MKKLITLGIAALLLLAPTAAVADDLTTLLRDLAAAELGLDPLHVKVVVDNPPQLATGIDEYTFRFASAPRGRTVVRARAIDQRSLSFTADVQIWADVAVALRLVDRGTTWSAETSAPCWRPGAISRMPPRSAWPTTRRPLS